MKKEIKEGVIVLFLGIVILFVLSVGINFLAKQVDFTEKKRFKAACIASERKCIVIESSNNYESIDFVWY